MNAITLIGMMILIILAAMETTKIVESQSISLPDCPDRCGDVKIPYPFGTSQGCYLSENFSINCSQSNSQLLSPTPFLSNGNLQITNISLEGELGIMHYGARDCYDKEGMQVINNRPRTRLSNFNISSAKNKFTAVGCDTYAIISGYRGETEYITGCISSCDRIDSYTTEPSCSGVGCCQTSIPSGLKNITVGLSSFHNHTFVHEFNPCSYAFVVEESKFNFSRTSFRDLNDTDMVPMVLNWAIGEESSCDEAESSEDFACKGNNSKCVEASNGPGYLCQCLPGYEGNPYLSDGCQDIDECKISNPCDKSSTCQNLPGNWTCICPNGGISSETGCSKVCGSNQSPRAFVETGYYISIIVIIFYILICQNIY